MRLLHTATEAIGPLSLPALVAATEGTPRMASLEIVPPTRRQTSSLLLLRAVESLVPTASETTVTT